MAFLSFFAIGRLSHRHHAPGRFPAVDLPIPRFPDPFRRVRVPKDLEAVTTRGEEVPAAEVGLDQAIVEKVWRQAERFYRSRVHPALGLTIRRDGQVILDRSLGHARGNGPGESAD